MPIETCIKCGSHMFGLKEPENKNQGCELEFIQCMECGGVVGIYEGNYIKRQLEAIQKKLDIINYELRNMK